MRHRKLGRKLSRSPSHRKALFRNQLHQLIEQERICTTDAKAKELRRSADKIITLAKRDDLHARRSAFAILRNKKATQKLFQDVAKRFEGRTSGYTRIYKYKTRRGDAAPLSLIEFVVKPAKKS
jgi:large subunit ribosomal protein L17